ncbi:N-formylglutamate amidohydrolase [Aestuariispira insulae]|uniref:N-formylglutamate amidohydrolase n=1 Tax=Aestuariispira insulae TaxID=1461337 RepID=A0A3D9HK77_9PROT|nr:N-formylglutamate amidohydrolase [Aestuariispira insulae]RED49825.1 N-formylglutamate amidohydrolase [Aestuariispira insulae]
MVERIPSVLTLTRPGDVGAVETPVLLDSPHSGTIYPIDFQSAVPMDFLRRMEDSKVDQLYERAPAQGASLLCAEFPRSYIDPNRGVDDLDWRLIADRWPGAINPTEKTRLGHGLIWRTCPGDRPMYDRLLSVSEVSNRIEHYWRPYHQALEGEMSRLFSLFGAIWHINCHSMPSASSPFMPGAVGGRRADIVLGDRDGRSCDPGFTEFVRDWFVNRGYRVRVNNPYKGAELVRLCGRPDHNRHSLQIEINRALYIDEKTLEPNRHFESLQRDLSHLVGAISVFALSASTRMAAE